MKKILLAVLSIAALASCMQDETIGEAQRENIVFENAFVDNATKAIDPSITTTGEKAIKEFQVWGATQGDHDGAVIVPIFKDETVDNEAGEWMYSAGKTQYWIAGNKYNFAAVVNGQNVAVGDNHLPKTIEYTADGTTDLLYARSTNDILGKASGNEKVGFTFKHLLSKAGFTFVNTTPAPQSGKGVIYTVSDVKISGLSGTATYDVDNGWLNQNTTYTQEFGHIVAKDADSKINTPAEIAEQGEGAANYECLLIPGIYTTATVTCTINLYLNGEVKEANLADVIKYSHTINRLSLKPGYMYNFALSTGLNEVIKFDVVEVEAWKPGMTPSPGTPDNDDPLN